VLLLINATAPIIVSSLEGIIAKKSIITGLPVTGISGLVATDIATLHNQTSAFEAAILPLTPANLVPAAQAIVTAVNAAFAATLAAYAS